MPTYVTLPGVVRLSGSVIVTGSPTLTSACCAASSSIVTCRTTDVIVSTGPGCTVGTERRCHARHPYRARLEHHRPEQQLTCRARGRVSIGTRGSRLASPQ